MSKDIEFYQSHLSSAFNITKKNQDKSYSAFNKVIKEEIKKAWLETEIYTAANNYHGYDINEDQWLDRFCESLKESLKGKI